VTAFKAFPELLYIQIIQRDLEGVEVRIVKALSYRDPEDTHRVREELHIRLGREMRLDIRFCTTDEFGKIRSCYNRLPPELIERYGIPAVGEFVKKPTALGISRSVPPAAFFGSSSAGEAGRTGVNAPRPRYSTRVFA